jgi:hypothetical protein
VQYFVYLGRKHHWNVATEYWFGLVLFLICPAAVAHVFYSKSEIEKKKNLILLLQGKKP